MTETMEETTEAIAEVPKGELETRSGDGYQVADVDFPKRIVTVIAMPYERPTVLPWGDRMITEVVSRGAFDGIERRTRQIRANRDHTWDKLCGKVVALHPSRKEGLVTEIKMYETTIGEETLRICDEGGLDASAGFRLLGRDRARGDSQVWERNNTVRRLNRLYLDHVALVPNPQYEGTNVLDVRQAVVPSLEPVTGTPNRDRLEIDILLAKKEELDRRWLH